MNRIDAARPSDRRDRRRGRLSILLAPLYSILRFIARHVRGFWGAIAAFLTAGIIVGGLAAAVFVAFASVVTGGATQSFDESVLHALATRRSPGLDELMLEITGLGNGSVLLLVAATASVFLWLTSHRWSVYILMTGIIGGQIVNRLLKEAFGRDRPGVVEWVDMVHSPSFPSGHAMTSFIVYGSVAYLVARLEPTRALRRFTYGIAALIILAIGFSRMYLGVHYPSDVLAGFLAGLAWLAFVAASTRAVQYFAPRRPETAQEDREIVHPPAAQT